MLRNEATSSFSTTDQFAVSQNLYRYTHDVKICDSGINFSDHSPLILVLDALLSHTPNASYSSNIRY